jgi:hypothetical protein
LLDELLQFTRAGVQREIALRPVPLAPRRRTWCAAKAAAAKSFATWPPTSSRKPSPRCLARALGNVLRNAVRYAGDAGAIVIRAAARNGEVDLTVADQGPGVPRENLPRLFDAFYRPDVARTRESGGAGLGLCDRQDLRGRLPRRVVPPREPRLPRRCSHVVPFASGRAAAVKAAAPDEVVASFIIPRHECALDRAERFRSNTPGDFRLRWSPAGRRRARVEFDRSSRLLSLLSFPMDGRADEPRPSPPCPRPHRARYADTVELLGRLAAVLVRRCVVLAKAMPPLHAVAWPIRWLCCGASE